MSTQTDTALLSDLRGSGLQSVNDRTRRFCYTGGTPYMAIDQKKSGLRCNPITGGQLHQLVARRQGYTGMYDPQKKQYPKLWHWDMPGDYASMLERRFQTGQDMGYRNLPMLTSLPYELTKDKDGNETYSDDAYDYFAVVHPTLANCPSGLNRFVQLTDPSAGQSTPVYQHCPTCQLQDLKSQACLDRISQAVESRPAFFNLETLLELRDALIAANEASLAFTSRSLEAVKAEIDGRKAGNPNGRTHYNVVDLIHFKMHHKEQPINEQSTLITQLVQGLKQDAAPAVDPELVEQLKAFTAWQKEQAEKKAADAERMAKVRAGRKKDEEPAE